MWNIGGLIPKNLLNRADININEFVKVESSRLFDLPSSIRAQSGRRLSHRQLTKFVNYAEKQGLGTPDDILLCIIPTFSFFDCLPNNAVLAYDQLLPKPFGSFNLKEQGGKCIDHANLLDCVRDTKGMKENEYLSLAAVVNTMEFVYLMALHVEKAKVCGVSKKTHPEEFVQLLELLFEHFHNYLRRLSPFYELQRRREMLKSLFERLEIGTKNNDTWPTVWKGGDEEEVEEAFKHNVGFGKWHCEVAKINQLGHLDLRLILHSNDNTGMARDIFGWTPLHYAATRPDLSFRLEKETPKSEEPETTLNESFQTKRWVDKFRRSPIHTAAASGNINLLRILLPYLNHEAKWAIFKGGIDEMDPLHLAAQGEHKNCSRDTNEKHLQQDDTRGNRNECIVWLMKHRPKVQNNTDAWKQSPIQTAVTQQCYECALSLLQNKAIDFSPETPDEFKKPLLHYLKGDDNQHCLIGKELLLKHYQKFDIRKRGGDNILHHAITFLGHYDFCNLLGALYDTIGPDQPDLNIDVTNSQGQTPLYLAVFASKSRIVNELVRAGASPAAKDNNGISPMILACQRGDGSSAMYLLENKNYRGIETDPSGRTALHHAASSPKWSRELLCLGIVQRLLDVMKSIDVRDNQNETPLQSAIKAKREAVCLALLQSKASINLVDLNSLSALNKIVLSSPATETKQQAKWEAQIKEITTKHATEQDKDGNTAWHTAVFQERDDTLDWLMNIGAGLKIKNNSGATAFIEACRRNKCHKFIREIVSAVDSGGHDSTDSQTHQHETDGGVKEADSTTKGQRSVDGYPLDINEGDSTYDQSPLAWACENGFDTVVKILLTSKTIDVRRKATKYHNWMPLRFAVNSNKPTIVLLLLDHPDQDDTWNVPQGDVLTMIRFASKNSDNDSVYKLLMHPKVGPRKLSYNDLGAILKDCSGCNIQADKWATIVDQVGLNEETETHYLDSDNWTLADIAGKYGHPDLGRHLAQKIDNSTKASYPLRPSVFLSDYPGLYFTDSASPGTSQRIKMNVTFSKTSYENFCFRTKEPISPEASDFYFEVKIIYLPKNRVFMMGYCREEISEDQSPGWEPGSWAYHTDDGGLYEGNGWPVIRDSEHICETGDVIRCGVNFKTGKGYVTRNGDRLDSDNAFRDDWLKIGKLYPCVGFRDDGDKDQLRVEIFLPGSGKLSSDNSLSQSD